MNVTPNIVPAKWHSSPAEEPDELCPFPITEPPRILIVEDDPQLAEIIGKMLSGIWFNCVIRRSGTQGIDAFLQDPIDLIITDLRMEAGDGIALIQTIRRTSQVPVIIVTGYAREYADRVRFLNNVAIIHKPFDWAVLVDLVEKAVDTGNSNKGAAWNTLHALRKC